MLMYYQGREQDPLTVRKYFCYVLIMLSHYTSHSSHGNVIEFVDNTNNALYKARLTLVSDLNSSLSWIERCRMFDNSGGN